MKKNKIIAVGLTGALVLTSSVATNLLNYNVAVASENIEKENLDIKNLPDGEYTLDFSIINFSDQTKNSMADGAVEKPAKLIVKNGQYSVDVTFKPLQLFGKNGYLGNLEYYIGNNKMQAEIVSYYSPTEIDEFFNIYKQEFPTRNAYPKILRFPINKENIGDNKKLQTKVNVFVPVMASLNRESGNQNALPTFDFSTLKVVKLDKQIDNKPTIDNTNSELKYVNLEITDESVKNSQVRRAVDKNAKIITKDNKKYLVLSYYSSQNWGADYIYDNGLKELWYNYDGTENKTKLTTKVIETGTHYEVSEVEIPLMENNSVYLYGKSQLNAITGTTQVTYGIINFKEGVKPEKSSKIEKPRLLRVSQLGSYLKDTSKERLPYDFEKNGELYSPYTADNGTKFKLADGKYEVEMQFDRPGLYESDLRYIKYTLDGTEPTFASTSADFRSQSADPSLNSSLYRILVNPLEDIANFSKDGGDVTVKVKAFNADGTKSSETLTYVLPFSEYYIDTRPVNFELGSEIYSANITSDNNYVLTEEVRVKTTAPEERVKSIITEKATALGLENINIVNISVENSSGKEYTPNYVNGWKEDKNPLLKLDLLDYDSSGKAVYYYDGENLVLIPTNYSKYNKKYSVSINKPNGYYVFATTNLEKLLAEQIQKLKEKVIEVEKILAEAPNTKSKIKLSNELEKAKKALKREKSLRLDNVVRFIENFDKYSKEVFKAKEDEQHIKEKAVILSDLIISETHKNILIPSQFSTLVNLSNELKANSNNVEKLKELISKVEMELDNLKYDYETENIEFLVENYSRPGVASMASGVFDVGAKLIYTPNKTYLEIPLKTMTFLGIRAHLTDLDFFKNELDKEEYKVTSLSKYEDISNNGVVKLFDKKIIVEIDDKLKDTYIVRLGNDGMGGAKPQAKFVIKTKLREESSSLGEELILDPLPTYEIKIENGSSGEKNPDPIFNVKTGKENSDKKGTTVTKKDSTNNSKNSGILPKTGEIVNNFNLLLGLGALSIVSLLALRRKNNK